MKRNKFSLSHYKLLTCDPGELVPIGCVEVLPGDSFQQATSLFIRATALNAPVMHPVRVRVHHWFVPTRLVWEDFEDFITGGVNGTDSSTPPTIDVSSAAVGSLADYLGLPTGVTSMTASALPFRVYGKIFNEWYRDQDLVTALTIDESSGTDTTTNTTLQKVAWEKDYFTTARPWTQRGSEVTLPLGTDAPVTGIGVGNSTWTTGPQNAYETDGTTAASYAKYKNFDTTSGNQIGYIEEDSNNTGYPNIRADLSNATAASIIDLREAFALQRYKEARARYGSRYTEYLRYLGVRSADSRLQRPEYLGGGKQNLVWSEIIQSAGTTDGSSTGVGDLKGHGVGALRTNRYRRFFSEHGYIMTMMSVQPKTIYANGLNKMWSRTTKEDYFQKELESIGADEVYNREVYADHTTPAGVFGYQDRYDDYRRHPSHVSGDFRSSLDHWHFARIFGSDPALNETFLTCNPSTEPFQSTATDNLLVMANHSIQTRRMLKKRGNPV
jgi:hypothetical protein